MNLVVAVVVLTCSCGSSDGGNSPGDNDNVGDSQDVATPMANPVSAQFESDQFTLTYGVAKAYTSGTRLLDRGSSTTYNGRSPTLVMIFCDTAISCSTDLTSSPGNCFAFYFLDGNVGTGPIDSSYTFYAGGYINSGAGGGVLGGSISAADSASYSGSVTYSDASYTPANSVTATNFTVKLCGS